MCDILFNIYTSEKHVKFNCTMWTSKQQQNIKRAQEQVDTKILKMYQSKQKTLHRETEMFEIWASWPVPNFHGSDAATQGDGIWGCPLTDNIHERVNFQRKSSTSEGLIYDVCFGICRHYRLLLQQKIESLAALPSKKRNFTSKLDTKHASPGPSKVNWTSI